MSDDRKPGRGGRRKHRPKSSSKTSSGDLHALLLGRMEACQTAEVLNDQVILPFISVLEDVCQARGYVMNIYGDQSNLVFSGDDGVSEEIYALVEAVLDAQPDVEEIDDVG